MNDWTVEYAKAASRRRSPVNRKKKQSVWVAMATRWVAIFFVFLIDKYEILHMSLIVSSFDPYLLFGGDEMKALIFLLTFAVALTGCSSKAMTIEPVQDFSLNEYLGSWYEIARIDFRYEENMDNTSAEYSLNSDGTVKVVNRGYDYVKKKWKESVGKAKFRGDSSVGALKVSFFGPFYSEYNIIALDDEYKYALVAGKNDDYLWILSRDKTLSDEIEKRYLEVAIEAGFDPARLIWVEHN